MATWIFIFIITFKNSRNSNKTEMATLIPGLPKQAKLATRLPGYQLFDQNRSKVKKIKQT